LLRSLHRLRAIAPSILWCWRTDLVGEYDRCQHERECCPSRWYRAPPPSSLDKVRLQVARSLSGASPSRRANCTNRLRGTRPPIVGARRCGS
jgi:hypothetical protein